jgi:hypothetical protein
VARAVRCLRQGKAIALRFCLGRSAVFPAGVGRCSDSVRPSSPRCGEYGTRSGLGYRGDQIAICVGTQEGANASAESPSQALPRENDCSCRREGYRFEGAVLPGGMRPPFFAGDAPR